MNEELYTNDVVVPESRQSDVVHEEIAHENFERKPLATPEEIAHRQTLEAMKSLNNTPEPQPDVYKSDHYVVADVPNTEFKVPVSDPNINILPDNPDPVVPFEPLYTTAEVHPVEDNPIVVHNTENETAPPKEEQNTIRQIFDESTPGGAVTPSPADVIYSPERPPEEPPATVIVVNSDPGTVAPISKDDEIITTYGDVKLDILNSIGSKLKADPVQELTQEEKDYFQKLFAAGFFVTEAGKKFMDTLSNPQTSWTPIPGSLLDWISHVMPDAIPKDTGMVANPDTAILYDKTNPEPPTFITATAIPLMKAAEEVAAAPDDQKDAAYNRFKQTVAEITTQQEANTAAVITAIENNQPVDVNAVMSTPPATEPKKKRSFLDQIVDYIYNSLYTLK